MPLRVLAVDDEADILHLIAAKLEKAGYAVSTAADGEAGLAQALAEKPDLMVVDVMMPKRDGYSVVAEVRRQLGAEAPVTILLTAKGQEQDVVQGLECGADDYVVKPFSPRELVERVRVALIKAGKLGAPAGDGPAA